MRGSKSSHGYWVLPWRWSKVVSQGSFCYSKLSFFDKSELWLIFLLFLNLYFQHIKKKLQTSRPLCKMQIKGKCSYFKMTKIPIKSNLHQVCTKYWESVILLYCMYALYFWTDDRNTYHQPLHLNSYVFLIFYFNSKPSNEVIFMIVLSTFIYPVWYNQATI